MNKETNRASVNIQHNKGYNPSQLLVGKDHINAGLSKIKSDRLRKVETENQDLKNSNEKILQRLTTLDE